MGRKKKNLKPATQAPSVHSQKEKSTDDNSIPWLMHAVVAAALFLITLITYSTSFRAGFPLDNRVLILQDQRVHAATSDTISQILNHTYWWPKSETGLYRPITTLSYLFNYAILGNGENPAGYHWINLLLHALNVFLVYLLAFRLLRKISPAALIAAVWAVHPVLTESVTNIIGRSDLIAGFSLLSGLLFYLKSTESAGWKRVAWLFGLMTVTAIGVFSKESAVAILGVIVLYELTWWKERRQLRGALLGCAAVAPPLLFMWYQRSTVLSASMRPFLRFVDNPLYGASFVFGRLTAIAVMAKYMWLLIWPVKLSCDYSYNQIPIASGSLRDWLSWVAVAAVIFAIATMYKRSPTAFFFAAMALVSFVPVSNILFLTGTIMAERFLYVPAIGAAGCLVLLIYALGRQIHWRPLAPVVLSVIMIAFGVRTWERNFDWQDDVTLWSAAVRVVPNSFKAHSALAFALNESDPTHSNLHQVLAETQKSLAILANLPDSLSTSDEYADAGGYYATEGDTLRRVGPDGELTATPESRLAYEESLQLLLKGVAIDKLLDERHRQEGLITGKSASEIAPIGLPALYDRLAWTYVRQANYPAAYDAAKYAQLLSPERGTTYIVMGQALLAANRKEDAAVSLMEGLLVSGDRMFLPLIQTVYKSGLDPNSCAIAKTGSGLFLDNACAPVHENICKGYADLIKVFLEDQRQAMADSVRSRAMNQFGCSAGELQ
jgi:hypothetical protein